MIQIQKKPAIVVDVELEKRWNMLSHQGDHASGKHRSITVVKQINTNLGKKNKLLILTCWNILSNN